MEHVSSRSFPLDDIRWFAAVSGDPNPVHIDPEFAARTYPGAVVAHGLHLVLWALETLPADDTAALSSGLEALFRKPVLVGDEVQAEVAASGAIRLLVQGQVMTTVKFRGGRPPERWDGGAPADLPAHPPVVQGPPESFVHRTGALRLPDARDALLGAFPNLGTRLGPRVLQGLAGIATVSGAVLGGVTTEFSVEFTDDEPGQNLEYRILSYHPGFRRFEMAFWGYGLIGKVAAISGGDAPAAA
jgi:MaoC like domain